MIDTNSEAPLDEQQPLHPATQSRSFLQPKSHHAHVVSVASPLSGYMLMCVAAVAQATRAFVFHLAEAYYGVPPSIALIFSSVVYLSLGSLTLHHLRMVHAARLPRTQLLQLGLRGLFAALTVYLNNVALAHVSVGTALTLLSTVPAMTSVLTALFLKDALSAMDIVVLGVNMAGVALVAGPSAAAGQADAMVGIAAGLGSAVCASIGFTLVKLMGSRVHYLLNTLSNGCSGVLIAMCVTSGADVQAMMGNGRGAVLALLGACVGFVAQTAVNRGMQMCRAGPALVVRTFNVPISFALGMIFLGEGLGILGGVGVSLVMMSVVYIGMSQVIREKTRFERERADKVKGSMV